MGPCGSMEVLPPPAEGFTHSPYPLVDQFVLSQWTRGGVEPSIRKWTLFPHGWCGNQWVGGFVVHVFPLFCGHVQGSAWCWKLPTTDGVKTWDVSTRATTSCERHTELVLLVCTATRTAILPSPPNARNVRLHRVHPTAACLQGVGRCGEVGHALAALQLCVFALALNVQDRGRSSKQRLLSEVP